MASGIDMTLDDLIKQSKESKPPRSRPASVAAGPGPIRRDFKRRAPRPSAVPYSVKKVEAVPEGTWKHDLFAAHAAAYPAQVARASAIETGTKLYISNLEYGVSNVDIKELFSEVGDLKRCGVHYDRSGRSKGTADVVFSRRADALAAVKRYNNVQLDGKPMKIEVVGTNIATPAPVPPVPAFVGGGAVQNGAPRSGQARGRVTGRARGGGSRGGRRGGRGGGRGRGSGEKVSLEDLDAELEKYHAGAMETN